MTQEAAPATTPAAPAAPAAPAPVPASAPLRASLAERIAAAGKGMAEIAKAAPPEPSSPAPAAVEPTDGAPPAPPADTKPPEEPQHKLLQRLAQLEREKRAAEESLKAIQPKAGFEDEIRALAASNPLAAAEKLGLSFEQLLELKLNGGTPTAETQQKQEQAELKKMVESLQKAREEDAQRLQQATNEKARQDWRAALKANAAPEKYPHVAALGDDAQDTAEEVFQGLCREKTKALGRPFQAGSEVPTQAEVLEKVEAYYSSLRERLLTAVQSTGTIPGTKAAGPAGTPAAATPSQQSGQRRSPTTLTNSVSTSAPPGNTRHLSMQERIRLAAQGLQRAATEE